MSEAFDLIRQVLCEDAEKSGCGKSPGGYCERCETTARKIHNALEALAIDKIVLDPSRMTFKMAQRVVDSPFASDDARAIAGAILAKREAA